ncbi:MAG: hypothetical protein V7K61_02060 [Nostoc sp.]
MVKIKIGDLYPLAIAPTQSYRQFSVKMLLLSEFLGTIGLSDDKFAVCLPIK